MPTQDYISPSPEVKAPLKDQRELARFLKEKARKNGEATYFTGIPCKHDHVAPRRVSNGVCLECEAVKRGIVGEGPRKKAMLAGEKTYYTGKPCKHGHDSVRYTVNGDCKACKDQGNFIAWQEKDIARYDRVSALCLRYANDLDDLKKVKDQDAAKQLVKGPKVWFNENFSDRVYHYLCSLPEELRAKYEHRHLLTPDERQEVFDKRLAVVQGVVEKFREKIELQELLGCKVKLTWKDGLVMHNGSGEFCAENILLTPVSE